MKRLNRSLAIGIVAVVGVGVSAFLGWRWRREQRREELMGRAPFFIQVLRRLRRELYPAFENLRGLAEAIRQQRSRIADPKMIDVPQEVERVIRRPDSTYRLLVEQAEQKVYAEFGIRDRAQFKRDCNDLENLDLYVQSLSTDIRNMERRALAGEQEIAPIPADTLNRLSKQLTFQTHKQLAWEEVQALHAAPQHRPDWSPEEEREAVVQLGLGEAKLETLDQNGFNGDEDFHPQHLFSAAVAHFSRSDNYFRVNVEALDTILKRVWEDFRRGSLRATPLASIRADIDWVILN